MHSLICDGCGAAVPVSGERFATCPYCGHTYDLAEESSARAGAVLLAADFRDPDLPGWKVYNKTKLRFEDRSVPQLIGKFPRQESTSWILESRGSFDNIDVAATLSFLEVEDVNGHCRLGFDVRWTEAGHYNADIAPKGNYCLGAYAKASAGKRWTMFVDYATHPDLSAGVGVPNRLRFVAYNDHLRVYINNSLVSSVRDSRFAYGTVGLVLENSGSAVVFAVCNLEIREALEAI